MFITICVIAYNEEQTLPAILKDIAAQDYAHGSMEVVLVDSASTDHTKKIMQEFAAQNTTQPDMGFVSVSVLDNPKRTLPCGWNVALKAYRGEAILKVDAHASIPKDFVTKNVAGYQKGEDGFIKNEGKDTNVLPRALAIKSSALRMLNRDETIDYRIKYFIDFLENSLSFEMLSPNEMRLSSRGTKESIGMSGKNLPSFIKQMTDEQKANFMNKLTRLFGDRISDIDVEIPGRPGWMQIVSTEEYENKSIQISSKEMSDGMLRLLAFVAISEIKSSNATMLLDEIENGVNTNYAEQLLEILKEMYAEKKHQLILTTHSTVFMDYIDAEDIVFLYRDNNG